MLGQIAIMYRKIIVLSIIERQRNVKFLLSSAVNCKTDDNPVQLPANTAKKSTSIAIRLKSLSFLLTLVSLSYLFIYTNVW